MASPRNDLLDFEKAIDYMDPFDVTDYLQKVLDFLNRNNTELCFPNLSSYTEAFLVRLVTENKNLKSKALNLENKQLATEIINVLDINRDVFRWTYTYESGRLNKDLLVYKKIYTNKLKMKPSEIKLPTSTIAQRLAMAKSQDAPSSKTQLLNMTLRFIKNDSERTLYYPEMPITLAQYIYSILKHPKSDLNVGFGYKSLCAPLFEALEVYGLDYEFEISFVETDSCETAALKLEKKLRKDTKKSSNDESLRALKLEKNQRTDTKKSSKGESSTSLNSSLSSTKKTNKKSKKKDIKDSFIVKTLKRLLNFTGDPEVASVTFEQMSDEQLAFIRGLKTLAGSPENYGSLEAKFGDALRMLNRNIVEVMKTYRLRIEEGVTKKSHCKFLTVKKVPKETVSATPERYEEREKRSSSVPRNKSVSSVKSRDRSLSKERRIQFKSGGKLDPTIDHSIPNATEKTEPKTTDKIDRAKADSLNARKTKLLEDMSVPVESDIGMRMMLLMGWSGGALGARGDGILEPLLPAIELPQGAGLGHVPPPKPAKGGLSPDLRPALLQNMLLLLQNNVLNKEIEFKAPLNKKDKQFMTMLLKNVNQRSMLSLGVAAEMEMLKQIMRAMVADVQIVIGAKMDSDRKITLIKSHNPTQKNISKMAARLNKKDSFVPPSYSMMYSDTVLNPKLNYEAITEEDVKYIMEDVIPTLNTSCKTAVAIKSRATRILLLMKFIDMVKSDDEEREFRLLVKLPKKPGAFLTDVVHCVNSRTRSTFVTPEEMCYYDELAECSEGWMLSLQVNFTTQYILHKTPHSPEYQNRFYNSAWPKPADNNNDVQTNNQNPTKDSWAKNDDVVITDDEEDKIVSVVVNNEEREVKLDKIDIANNETECDIADKDNEVNDNKVGIVKTEDVDELSDSLCVCDTNVDISELDKDIQDLELAIFEADLDISVKKENSDVSPISKRSRSNSTNSQELSTKRSKISSKNCLIITPNDPEQKINVEIIKVIQTRISEEISKCTYFLPLLKCHGIQNEGLMYSCHDEKDIEWLKKIITDVDLDLKVRNSTDDVCIEQKSRKMVIKINSYIPLDSKKVFKRFETYNNGLQTSLWKVLAEETFNTYVLFIVDIDENSFKYISKENFSLYVGIDKAQFTVIS